MTIKQDDPPNPKRTLVLFACMVASFVTYGVVTWSDPLTRNTTRGLAFFCDALLVLFVLFGLGILVRRLLWWIVRARIRREPRLPIAGLVPNMMVKVVGRIVPVDGLITAPASGRDCVAYQTTVDHNTGEGVVRVIDDWDACPFLIADETGSIRVDAIPCRIETANVFASQTTPTFVEFLEKHRQLGKFGINHPGQLSLMVHEKVLFGGVTAAVSGLVERRPARSGAGTEVVIGPPARGMLVVCDDPLAWGSDAK